MTSESERVERVALITGVGRSRGIGVAIADRLIASDWSVVTSGWRSYDERMPWGADRAPIANIEADLADPVEPARIIDEARSAVGPITALVLCHTESVDSSILDTTVESFDRHFAVNARASWLLIKAFAEQFEGARGDGRIVAITSDHTAHNLPYGASKGSLDRIVIAAASELAHLGITANVINPGATDTGWMGPDLLEAVARETLLGRVGTPDDCARLVDFLCSADGGWINGQLLYSDGGRA